MTADDGAALGGWRGRPNPNGAPSAAPGPFTALARWAVTAALDGLAVTERDMRACLTRLNDDVGAAWAAGIPPQDIRDRVNLGGGLGVLAAGYLKEDLILRGGTRPPGVGPGHDEFGDLRGVRGFRGPVLPGGQLAAAEALARDGADLLQLEARFAAAVTRWDDAAELAAHTRITATEARALAAGRPVALSPVAGEYVTSEIDDSWDQRPPIDLAAELADGTEPPEFWLAAERARVAKGSGDYNTAAALWERAAGLLPPGGHPVRGGLDTMITSLRAADGTGRFVTWNGVVFDAGFAGVAATGDPPAGRGARPAAQAGKPVTPPLRNPAPVDATRSQDPPRPAVPVATVTDSTTFPQVPAASPPPVHGAGQSSGHRAYGTARSQPGQGPRAAGGLQ